MLGSETAEVVGPLEESDRRSSFLFPQPTNRPGGTMTKSHRRYMLILISTAALLTPALASRAVAAEPDNPQVKNELASIRNLLAIGNAMSNHFYATKRFPSATGIGNQFRKDDNTYQAIDRPHLSWRVSLLRYFDDPKVKSLAEQFKYNEPWDSDHNKKLIEKMPDVYKSPGSKVTAEFKTVYLTPRSDKSLFPANNKRFGYKDVTDGKVKTMTVVEASDDRAVIWTKPDDYDIDEQNPSAGIVGLRSGEFLALFLDGVVRVLPANIAPEHLNALYTRAGGETIDLPIFDQTKKPSEIPRSETKIEKADPPSAPKEKLTKPKAG
jgi:hypothetical protein